MKTVHENFSLLRVKDKNDPNFGRDGVPYEIDSYWRNIEREADTTDRTFVFDVATYNDHGTSERYPSEVKSDMTGSSARPILRPTEPSSL